MVVGEYTLLPWRGYPSGCKGATLYVEEGLLLCPQTWGTFGLEERNRKLDGRWIEKDIGLRRKIGGGRRKFHDLLSQLQNFFLLSLLGGWEFGRSGENLKKSPKLQDSFSPSSESKH